MGTALTSKKWLQRIPFMLFSAVLLWFVCTPFSLLDFPLDDAWIHRVYSSAFAHGHGFEYNPGQLEAGSTSPLWSIVTAPAHWLAGFGTDAVVLAVKAIGVILAFVSIRLVQQCGQRIGQSNKIGIIAAALFALDPRLVFSALSGMETNLLLVLWIGAALCLITGRFFLATLLISLAPTARPEALVILPLYALAAIIAVYLKKFDARRLAWLALLPAPMLIWSLFCKTANGHWLPTTFYMKSTSPAIGFGQLHDAWTLLGLNGPLPSTLVVVLLVVAFYFLLRRYRSPEAIILLVAAPFAFLLGVLFSRKFLTVGYYWLRWTDPPVIILTATAAIALGMAIERMKGRKAHLAVAIIAVFTLPHFLFATANWRARLVSDCRSINLITVQAGKWLCANTPENAVIAVNDAGATRFFSHRKTIDLMGLNCADIAFGHMNPENTGVVDYLAITPTWFYGKGLYDGLPVRASFAIPPQEYTITSNKGQSEIVIFKCPRS